MPYPPYTVTFRGKPVPGDPLETDGSHTFRLNTPSAQMEVSLKHRTDGDSQPTLDITFTEK